MIKCVRNGWKIKHDENRVWTDSKIKEVLSVLNNNTNKAIKEIGQLSINSKPQKLDLFSFSLSNLIYP